MCDGVDEGLDHVPWVENGESRAEKEDGRSERKAARSTRLTHGRHDRGSVQNHQLSKSLRVMASHQFDEGHSQCRIAVGKPELDARQEE